VYKITYADQTNQTKSLSASRKPTNFRETCKW
jgi:hypothetical protein